MKKITPIALAFTPNYFIPAVTCISSILKNSSPTAIYEVICLLTEDLASDQIKLLDNFDPKRLTLKFINLSGALEGVYIDERYTIAASFRLLLPEILKDYEQVLYLDCDIIVRNDLNQLYHTVDLKNYYLAAVYEAALDSQKPYLKQIGCEPGYYFNSGFLIMNLNKMRADNLSTTLIDGLKVPYLQFPDQDVLNMYCKGKVLGLEPIYNSIRTYFLPQYKREFLRRYKLEDWEKVQHHGNIHYTGAKPWNNQTVKFNIWWQYYNKLPLVYKKQWRPDQKMEMLSKILSFPIIGNLYEYVINGYRNLKA